MPLDEKAHYLIAAGAAIAVGCEECLQACIALARHTGADEGDIRMALAIGRRIMHCAARDSDETAKSANTSNPKYTGFRDCCGCTDGQAKKEGSK